MMKYLNRLPRYHKRLIMVAADFVFLPLALWLSICLRQSTLYPTISESWGLFVAAPMIAIPIFLRLGLYRAMVRFIELKAGLIILRAVTLSVVTFALVEWLVDGWHVARLIIYWMLALVYIMGGRLVVRTYYQRLYNRHCIKQRVAVYGAGNAGAQLVKSISSGNEYHVIAIFDDNPQLHGRSVGGIDIHDPAKLSELVAERGITQVFLAIPSASFAQRKTILARLEPLPVHVKTIPALHDLVTGKVKVDNVRDLDIDDLLGRNPVPPNKQLLVASVSGLAVLVTGAGGSIGSELCRQIMALNPRRLVLFELSEFALYQINMELLGIKAATHSDVEIFPILGSVNHLHRMEMILRTFAIETIYHAAAYKHVPLVEKNPIEGVRNNIFGTWRMAEAAMATGVRTFVLISTDKAVRPTSIMGATKRFAELILQALAQKGGETCFAMVRFGNVLGSSGSVVPLFREQIRQGGPVTVTHPEMVRYFMTISEAAQLVLQSGSMATGGDVFVLDMGTAVKILDLARRMIHLSGFTECDADHPEGDIAIEFSGLRSGEKLYEELLIGGKVDWTEHPRIMRAYEEELPWEKVFEYLVKLDKACHSYNGGAVRDLLREAISGYHPQCEFEDYLWTQLREESLPEFHDMAV
ncbi:MAG: polysaccharide biosynthesis protein [Gammaproteobacteria bacterium]